MRYIGIVFRILFSVVPSCFALGPFQANDPIDELPVTINNHIKSIKYFHNGVFFGETIFNEKGQEVKSVSPPEPGFEDVPCEIVSTYSGDNCEITFRNSKGTMIERWTEVFDAQGNKREATYYDKNGNMSQIRLYSYVYKNGLVVKRTLEITYLSKDEAGASKRETETTYTLFQYLSVSQDDFIMISGILNSPNNYKEVATVRKGKPVSVVYFDNDQVVKTYLYNQNGDIEKEFSLTDASDVSSDSRFYSSTRSYLYDQRGNKTERAIYEDGKKDSIKYVYEYY